MPHLILTGGDPLEHPDLFPLIDEARRFGVGVSVAPAASSKLSRATFEQLKDHGADGIGLSLDGSNTARHDAIRGVAGTFERALQAMERARTRSPRKRRMTFRQGMSC